MIMGVSVSVIFILLQSRWNTFAAYFHSTSATKKAPLLSQMGDKLENMLWFIHISDTHVSQFHPEEGYIHLKNFIKDTLPLIRPEFVVHTGDIVDAKYSLFSAKQFEEEWKMYNELITENDVGKWYDMRGNHDCFSVHGDLNNFFPKYSSMKEQGYRVEIQKPFGKYSLISFDACPQYGTARMFNFFGHVDKEQSALLSEHIDQSIESSHIFLASHYPLITLSFDKSFDQGKFSQASLYLNGHLHNNGIADRKLYARQGSLLELEIGDMKKPNSMRIVAVDHNLISFLDSNADKKSFVVLTNPKDSTFLLPQKEPLEAIKDSTHIRMLVFGEVEKIEVFINSEKLGDALKSEEPLWTLAWDPLKYSKGTHEIELIIWNGDTYSQKSPFSVDGTIAEFKTSKILSFEAIKFFQFLSYSSWAVIVVILALSKFIASKTDFNAWKKEAKCKFQPLVCSAKFPVIWLVHQYRRFVYGALIFSSSSVFWPNFLFTLFYSFGPLYIGKMVEGDSEFGLVFLAGIIADGRWFFQGDTFVFPTFEVLFKESFYFLILFRLASKRVSGSKHEVFAGVLLVWFVLLEAVSLLIYYESFGLLFVFLSPVKFWKILLQSTSIIYFIRSNRMSQ